LAYLYHHYNLNLQQDVPVDSDQHQLKTRDHEIYGGGKRGTGKRETKSQGWKMQDWKTQDWKKQDRGKRGTKFAGMEKAG